jgi:hypothetical protein
VLAMLGLYNVIRGTSPAVVVFLIWPSVIFWKFGLAHILMDAAHGPPFLTLAGIFVFYWVPSIALGAYLFVTRQKQHAVS